MSAPYAPHHHVDSPASWRPKSAHFEVAGWLYPGPSIHAIDIRARIDGQIFLGIHGLDRHDTEETFGPGLPAVRTGFMIRVQAWRGARELALEWHNGTQWSEFFRTKLETSDLPSDAVRPVPILRAGLVRQSLHYLYRHFHRASWAELRREADQVIRDVVTPASDVAADRDFLGFIENPGFWINAGYGKFRITGWLFGVGREIRRLSATTGVLTENRLVYPKDRPDVASHRHDHANALKSGFYGLVDIRADTPSPANLKIFAEDAEGRRILVLARRMHLDRRDEHNGPVPVFGNFLFYRVVAAFLRGALTKRFVFDSWKEARAEIVALRAHLASSMGRSESPQKPAASTRRRDLDPYSRWCWHNRMTSRLRNVLAQDARIAVETGGPLISVLVPAFNTPEKYLQELLDGLQAQIYPRWELCIADDASTQPHVRRMLEQAGRADARIKPVFRSENGHIARATNSALDAATGEFVALLDHDDLLPCDSLLHVAMAIQRHPGAGYLYTDEDKIDDHGKRFDPQFKGGWSPEMAITHNYTHHLTVIRRSIVEKAGRLRPECNGAQDIDLFLRCWELMDDKNVIHVPFIGYHWRAHAESTATRGDQKTYLFEAARRAIEDATKRRGLAASPLLPGIAQNYALCLHQLKWNAELNKHAVTAVIPTKNRPDLLRACIDSLVRTTPPGSIKIIVVDDGSDEAEALDYLETLPNRVDVSCEVLRQSASAGGFNYSRLVNLGTAKADTPLVLHLNNDVEALAPGWLEDMAGWLSIPGVGIVGAKLLHPDGTINHAGISLGRDDGLPHVLFDREPSDDLGYVFLPHAARNVVAVTGACLLTRTELYRTLGGFDETSLPVAYNDVDFCLRAHQAGYRTVFTPQAVLRHLGSATRGKAYAEGEHVAYLARHGHERDPYHSEALDFPPRNLPLNPYSQRYAQTARPFRALVVTHNLNFEGAPIFIFELARHLAEQPGVEVTVVSPQDGPLRSRFESSGLSVEIWDVSKLSGARSPTAFAEALSEFAASRSGVSFDVWVCNTMLSYWAVHLAGRLGQSSALYIHESNTVKRFFAPLLPPIMHATVEEAFRLATRVVFTAQATRSIFEDLNINDNFRTLRSWVDFGRIEAFKRTHDRATLRRKHGFDPDATLIVNIGSVCERKGQHIYIRAIDLLKKEMSAELLGKNVQWVAVGAREGLYMETLMEDVQLMGLHEVKILPETPDIYDFYQLADLLVCTSFEESFPRVLLEAMVFGTRIVSTDVNGITEMLTNTDEAYLVPAGDPFKLAGALKRALADHWAGDGKMISMAHARATRNYHQVRALPAHVRMIREAWLG